MTGRAANARAGGGTSRCGRLTGQGDARASANSPGVADLIRQRREDDVSDSSEGAGAAARRPCLGIVGRLFGHKFADIENLYDFCLRCGMAKDSR